MFCWALIKNVFVYLQGFPFLYNQIRDNINVRQSCNLIFSLCRWNEQLAVAVSTCTVIIQ